MLGFIVFLICLLIVGVLVRACCEEFAPGNANIRKIALLLVLLFAILWLAGFGGWNYTTNFHPWQR
jgi:hypothetical protein